MIHLLDKHLHSRGQAHYSDLLSAHEKTKIDLPYDDRDLVKCIHSKFNKSLYFSPSSSKMAFTVRDPVRTGLYKVSYPRGFAQRYVCDHLATLW